MKNFKQNICVIGLRYNHCLISLPDLMVRLLNQVTLKETYYNCKVF